MYIVISLITLQIIFLRINKKIKKNYKKGNFLMASAKKYYHKIYNKIKKKITFYIF